MFIRHWRARTSVEQEARYLAAVRETVLPHLRATPGYRRSSFLRRPLDDGSVEILVLTHWESREAAGGLSDEEGGSAWLPDEIARTLDDHDEHVLLYESMLEDDPDDWPPSPRGGIRRADPDR